MVATLCRTSPCRHPYNERPLGISPINYAHRANPDYSYPLYPIHIRTSTALKHLRACIQTASEHGQQDGLTAFIDWLAFALAVMTTPPTLTDSLQCRLYQHFQIQHMLIYPYDYFGDLISESLTSSYNHHAFFPTPHPLSRTDD